MNIKWENLLFLPFAPAYLVAKNPWLGIVIGILFILGSLYLLRGHKYFSLILPVAAGTSWILFGTYEYSLWQASREYWELILIIPPVYLLTLIALIQIFISRKRV